MEHGYRYLDNKATAAESMLQPLYKWRTVWRRPMAAYRDNLETAPPREHSRPNSLTVELSEHKSSFKDQQRLDIDMMGKMVPILNFSVKSRGSARPGAEPTAIYTTEESNRSKD